MAAPVTMTLEIIVAFGGVALLGLVGFVACMFPEPHAPRASERTPSSRKPLAVR